MNHFRQRASRQNMLSRSTVYRTTSRRRGASLAELAGALVVVIPIILIIVDLVIIAIGASINDSVCKDAARAAASGPPADNAKAVDRRVRSSGSPYERALKVVKSVYNTNIPAKVREKLLVTETVRDVPPPPAGGAVDGEVSVQTTVDIYPPFIIGLVVPDKAVTLKSKHIVPFTYVVPPS